MRLGNTHETIASNDAGARVPKTFRPTQSRSQIYELGSFREQGALQGRDMDAHVLAMRGDVDNKGKPSWSGQESG